MTREEIISTLECMAIDMTGGIAGISNKSPMHDLLEKRIEAINAAQHAIREQEERRWIPVTERLPELGERVLCTDGVAVFEQYRVELSCVYWIWERFGLKSPMQEVTHWMPLPEPPKEDA